MFNFKKQDPITKAVEEAIGSRQKYIGFIKEYTLTKEEKDILLQASISVKKKEPNKKVVVDAYNIMLATGAIVEDFEMNDAKTEESTVDEPLDEKDILEDHSIEINTNNDQEAIKKDWFWWSVLGVISSFILLIALQEKDIGPLYFIIPLAIYILILRFIWNFLLSSEQKTFLNKPIGVKIALFLLRSSFMLGISVGLFAILSMTTHENTSSLMSSVFI